MPMPPDYKDKSIIDKMVACTPQLPSSPSPKDHWTKSEHKFVCKRNSNLITYLTHSPGNPLLPSFPGAPFSPGGPGRPCLPVGSVSSMHIWEGVSIVRTYVHKYVHQGAKCTHPNQIQHVKHVSMHICTYIYMHAWTHTSNRQTSHLEPHGTPWWYEPQVSVKWVGNAHTNTNVY